jgi:hypothetical protein
LKKGGLRGIYLWQIYKISAKIGLLHGSERTLKPCSANLASVSQSVKWL